MPDIIIPAPFVKQVPTTEIPITQDPFEGLILTYNPQNKLAFAPVSNFREMIISGTKEATPTSSPTAWAPGDPYLFEKWDVKTAGTYTNFKDNSTPTPQPIVVSSADLSNNFVQIWVTNGVSEKVSKALPSTPVVDGFNSSSTTDSSSAKNAKTLMDITKVGAVRDWVLGAYSTNEVVRYLGLEWVAGTNITSAVPGANANWKIYYPFLKPVGIFVSDASTFTVNLVNNTCVFTGASTNKIITPFGSINIPAQTVDCSANPTYYTLVYNTTTALVRAVAVFDSAASPLKVDDYMLCYVMNLNGTLRDIFGAKKYRLIDSNGTVDYPIKPIATTDVIYNKLFSTYQTSRTDTEKLWLAKAIVDLEFYNIRDAQTVTFYTLGKNYTSKSYLGFGVAETGKPSIFLYADEFNNSVSIAYDANAHKGVKTYYLRSGTDRSSTTTIYGKVTIDWDAIPMGAQIFEGNSGIAVNNSNIVRTLFKKSEVFNNPTGFVKFARSRSFNDYYTAPTMPSYASGPNTGVPKSPFEDCRQWATQWDAFVTSPPAGYTVTKETLTTAVPTDGGGTLPIYGYVFSPAKLAAGDSTGNNSQTLPRIFINCSIHGFEKTPSFVVYEMMKQILTNWKSHSFLEYLRFNVEFCIIPFANPHGWNTGGGAGSRKNFNNVDLNRNFPAFWVGGGTPSDNTYPGINPLSEIESQSIYTWMQGKITSNTVMGIDFHNFHGQPETDPKKYNMAWVVNLGSELGQSSANILMKELSVKYKAKYPTLPIQIPQTDDYFIGQSNNYNGPGFSGSAMKALGSIYASTFEVCQNFRFNPSYQSHDSDAITCGVETFVNYLRVFLQENLEEYNRVK
ncbi:M14 family zinc carboxypeptidase [Chryseobacterium sp. ON_d1]|uniref:M14 family zinc carboxypeptidase n=1 Tax=Chryseobacterium sp. ON_d1 TaxID=2583211 RepID=UPI00115713BA|nr:M14 family zinc carboxypeptidase [Chryseobacterium sp. ON_d1]GEJ46005.1 hypothetical protein CRS_26130 [Chryseobacterium sp. ON_d1]